MSMDREGWRERLKLKLQELQPELGELDLGDGQRLGDDLGVDSLVLEELFAWLQDELPAPLPAIAWANALEASEGRVGTLLDLIGAHELAHA